MAAETKSVGASGHETTTSLERVDEEKQSALARAGTLNKVLTFFLGHEEYAIDILFIEEITRPLSVTYVPRVPPYIMGVISLRGRVIPVLNLHVRLGLTAFALGKKTRFIICQMDDVEVGLVADKVNDVVSLDHYQLEPPPAKIAASGSGFIKNIGHIGERVLIVLDIEKVLQIHFGRDASS